MGDLDSLAREDREVWEEQGVLFQVMPVRKDQTDVELAVDYALEAGAESISWWGRGKPHRPCSGQCGAPLSPGTPRRTQ